MFRMTIAELRKDLGLTLEAFAHAVGLKSKGQMLMIERGALSPSVKVALRIEELSQGRIKAAEVNSTLAMIEARAS